jgi:hypothetical protein
LLDEEFEECDELELDELEFVLLDEEELEFVLLDEEELEELLELEDDLDELEGEDSEDELLDDNICVLGEDSLEVELEEDEDLELEEMEELGELTDDMLAELKEDTLVSLVSWAKVLTEEDEFFKDSSISANKLTKSVGCNINGPVTRIFLPVAPVAAVRLI